MLYYRRADWDARPPTSRYSMAPSRVTHFFLHHAAAQYRSGADAMRSIQTFHQDSRGWFDYAYNWGVWDDGTIWEGRGWGAVGGHTKGWNDRSVAVCYMGDGRRKVPDAALRAIMEVADAADEHFGRRLTRMAHRDVGSSTCPGDWLYRWWDGGRGTVERSHPDVREGWKRHLEWMRRRR